MLLNVLAVAKTAFLLLDVVGPNLKWQKRLQAVVTDEARCVCDWGIYSRTCYDRIAELRSKVPRGIAFIAVSATLPPTALEELKRLIQFILDLKSISIGNDRRNIRLEVRYLNYKHKPKHLAFLPLVLKKLSSTFGPRTRLRRGDILISLFAEVIGMGCGISDVIRVVQYKYPSIISALVQRLDRAARNPQLQS
ncbi:hypothetical protein BX616_010476 [Lobosporangium transversale]|nr:hypothetical protein BX616_010476 [Lobosporangium transversale]